MRSKVRDSAVVYGMGASEKILGEFIRESNREDFYISTKFTPQIADEAVGRMGRIYGLNYIRIKA